MYEKYESNHIIFMQIRLPRKSRNMFLSMHTVLFGSAGVNNTEVEQKVEKLIEDSRNCTEDCDRALDLV